MATTDENEIAALRQEVAELKVKVQELVDAWRAGNMVLSIVKFSAGIASAVAVVWATWHGSKP